jgi:hypothetical protein
MKKLLTILSITSLVFVGLYGISIKTPIQKVNAINCKETQYFSSFGHRNKCYSKTIKNIKITSIKQYKKKRGVLLIKWNNQPKQSPSQIAYRIKGTHKWYYRNSGIQVKSNKPIIAVNHTAFGFKVGKKYQIKIRGRLRYDGENHYGKWSKIKTTKKVK